VSDGSAGPGWWLASDGRWYPPEQAPGLPPPTPPLVGPPPGAGYALPPDPGYGFAPPTGPPGYGAPGGYGAPPGGPAYGYVPAQKTNGLAIASLVCSLVWLGGLGSMLAIIFGFIARGQIRRSDPQVQGNGLALAGILVGFAGLVAIALFVTFVAVLVHHCDQSGQCTTNTYNFR